MDVNDSFLETALSHAKVAYRAGHYDDAFFLLQPFEYSDDPEALFYLGNLVADNQNGVSIDSSAKTLLIKSADLGYLPAEYKLRHLTTKNIHFWWTIPNRDLSEIPDPDILESKAKKGASNDIFLLGSYLIRCSEREQRIRGVRLLETIATEIPEAALILGNVYIEGKVVSKDEARALEWYRRAGAAGLSDGVLGEARVLFDANGSCYAPDKAEDLLLNISNDNTGAACLLGKYYLENEKNPRIFQKGVSLLRRAWDSGSDEAGYCFAEYCLEDPKNDEGRRIMEVLAQRGLPEAVFRLAQMYNDGGSVLPMPDKAAFYFNKAAEIGNADASWELARLFLNHRKNQCLDSVKSFLSQAADVGNHDAEYNLGILLYREVRDLPLLNDDSSKDRTEHKKCWSIGNQNGKFRHSEFGQALEYIKRAALGGHAEAALELSGFYEKGIGTNRNFREAEKWCFRAAEMGNAQAQYRLAEMYETCHQQSVEEQTVVNWYQKALSKGCWKAAYRIALLYRYGHQISRSDETANKYLQIAVEHDVVPARYEMGISFLNGWGVEKSLTKAKSYIYQAAMLEYIPAVETYGKIMLDNNSNISFPDDALLKDLFEKLSKNGRPEGDFGLFLLYQRGIGVPKDPNKALEILEKCAENKYRYALYELGLIYFTGNGVQKSYQKAMNLFLESAEKNVDRALHMTGICYLRGYGTAVNYKEAFSFFLRASEQGFLPSYRLLGEMCENGVGVMKNDDEAVRYYRLLANAGIDDAFLYIANIYMKDNGDQGRDYAAAQNWLRQGASRDHAGCCYELAKMYLSGRGVVYDPGEGMRLMHKAANLNHKDALYYLGKAYRDGMFQIPVNHQKSLVYLKAASEQNHSEATTLLGLMYLNGQGCEKNPIAAYDLLYIAAEHGSAEAQYQLALLYRDGCGVTQSYIDAYMWIILASVSKRANMYASLLRKEMVVLLTKPQLDIAQTKALKKFRNFITNETQNTVNNDVAPCLYN
ncbi:tetratricopeptide repeat protein [Succinimonas amylolytica]|uniref:tetratricopeptide repeat protein n=1 Tax=Succinimonas amylolytica TaxID=83769 RepID=UPI00036A60B8|nr:tetratricopeptide repeat protein [Succinimonas amylolytica]